jgi:hypothetical protein
MKTLTTPKRHKGKEKVPKPKEELPKHIDFHSSSKSSGDVYSLVLPLNQTKKKKKRENTCPRMSRGGQVSQDTKGGKSKIEGQNIERILALL